MIKVGWYWDIFVVCVYNNRSKELYKKPFFVGDLFDMVDMPGGSNFNRPSQWNLLPH